MLIDRASRLRGRLGRGLDISPIVPALLALAIAAGVAFLHSRHSFAYFRPSADDLLLGFFPWGPHLRETWGPHLGRVAGALLFFFSLPGLGHAALRLFRSEKRADLHFQIGAALAVWGTLGLLLPAARLGAPALRVVSVLLVLAGLADSRRAGFSASHELSVLLRAPIGWALAAFAGLYFLTTVVPETFYDALVYHLAAPAAWVRAGRLVDLPDVHLTRLPGLLQGLYVWALAWSDDRLCKLVTLGVGLAFTAAVAGWATRFWSARVGRWAALLILSSPMIGVNLWSCANDLLAALFFFLAFARWLEAWSDVDSPDEKSIAWAGFFFGAAAAAKYTALFGALFFAFDLLRRQRRARTFYWRFGFVFAAAAALPLLPWWFRTGFWTHGNPFFPKAAGLLGGDSAENIALLANWNGEARGAGSYFFRLTALLRESLYGVEDGRFGFIGPALLMLLPLLPFLRAGGPLRPLLVCAGLSYLMFAAATGRLRYFIPELAPLFIVAAAAFDDYLEVTRAIRVGGRAAALSPGPAVARLMRALVATIVLFNGIWLVVIFQRFNMGWDVVWGRVSAEDYLRREHIGVYGHPSQGAYDFLRNARASGKVLIVGEARTYRCPIPAWAGGSFNVPPFVQLVREFPTPQGAVRALRANGFTYLLLNAPELGRLLPEPYKATEYLARLGHTLDALPPPVYRDQWTILFRIPESA